MCQYIVIYGLLLDDFYIVLDNEKELKKFLKHLLKRCPNCHIQIFKSIEMELNKYVKC